MLVQCVPPGLIKFITCARNEMSMKVAPDLGTICLSLTEIVTKPPHSLNLFGEAVMEAAGLKNNVAADAVTFAVNMLLKHFFSGSWRGCNFT